MSCISGADNLLLQIHAWQCVDYDPNYIKSFVTFFNITELRKVDKIKQIINDIITKFNHSKSTLIGYKDDTNIIVLILDDIVIKLYHIDHFNSIKQIIDHPHTNIETVLSKYELEDIVVIVNEKIIPMLSAECILNPDISHLTISGENIFHQISDGLCHIHKSNYIHNDVSLDNIGLKIVKDKIIYVLFDFGASKINYDKELFFDEFNKLRSSIMRYL
jgi:serine/threonine protein kinase